MLKYINYKIACYPSLYIPIYRVFGQKQHCLINEDTKIVIEGFERSANTFAVVAFKHAQKTPIHIAHHLHVPAHVLEGIKRNLPVLVLIRNPIDAITSFKIRYPSLNENDGLKGYISFYSRIIPVIDRVVIGKFEDVISDYGTIINNINKKFNTDFEIFDHTADEEKIVFEKIENIFSKQNFDKSRSIAMPMEEREILKNNIRLLYREKLMNDAVHIYENILAQV